MTTPDAGHRLTELRQSLGRTGIWAPPPERFGSAPVELAAAVEKLGFGSLWIGGSHLAPDAFTHLVSLLDGSSRLVIGTGSPASGAASRPTCARAPTPWPRVSPGASSSAWA